MFEDASPREWLRVEVQLCRDVSPDGRDSTTGRDVALNGESEKRWLTALRQED